MTFGKNYRTMRCGMGHDIFSYRKKHEVINDWDIAAVRHFLVLGSRALGLSEVAAFAERWRYHGPGVWTDIDLQPFLQNDPIHERQFCAALDAAEGEAKRFGDRIPADYLNEHADLGPGSDWGEGLPVKFVLATTYQLKALVVDLPPMAPWDRFPQHPELSSTGWTKGYGESYLHVTFLPWWRTLTTAQQGEWTTKHPPPPDWVALLGSGFTQPP